jgi:hypothetical protein
VIKMIDEEATYSEFEYYARELTPRSDKRIIAVCDKCGRVRKLRKADYRPLCLHCIQKGRKRSAATRRKMSEAKKRKNLSEETRKRKSDAQRGEKNHNWQGGPIKRICPVCGKVFSVKRYKIKNGMGKYCSISCGSKVNIQHRSFVTQHTKPELIFESICVKNNLPFKYVGDRSFWIGKNPSLNPDFIHTNKKQKICVEVLGARWHNSLLNQNISYTRTYDGRKALLKSYGWKMVGIWDHDLLREDSEAFVLYTLKAFIPSIMIIEGGNIASPIK